MPDVHFTTEAEYPSCARSGLIRTTGVSIRAVQDTMILRPIGRNRTPTSGALVHPLPMTATLAERIFSRPALETMMRHRQAVEIMFGRLADYPSLTSNGSVMTAGIRAELVSTTLWLRPITSKGKAAEQSKLVIPLLEALGVGQALLSAHDLHLLWRSQQTVRPEDIGNLVDQDRLTLVSRMFHLCAPETIDRLKAEAVLSPAMERAVAAAEDRFALSRQHGMEEMAVPGMA